MSVNEESSRTGEEVGERAQGEISEEVASRAEELKNKANDYFKGTSCITSWSVNMALTLLRPNKQELPQTTLAAAIAHCPLPQARERRTDVMYYSKRLASIKPYIVGFIEEGWAQEDASGSCCVNLHVGLWSVTAQSTVSVKQRTIPKRQWR